MSSSRSHSTRDNFHTARPSSHSKRDGQAEQAASPSARDSSRLTHATLTSHSVQDSSHAGKSTAHSTRDSNHTPRSTAASHSTRDNSHAGHSTSNSTRDNSRDTHRSESTIRPSSRESRSGSISRSTQPPQSSELSDPNRSMTDRGSTANSNSRHRSTYTDQSARPVSSLRYESSRDNTRTQPSQALTASEFRHHPPATSSLAPSSIKTETGYDASVSNFKTREASTVTRHSHASEMESTIGPNDLKMVEAKGKKYSKENTKVEHHLRPNEEGGYDRVKVRVLKDKAFDRVMRTG